MYFLIRGILLTFVLVFAAVPLKAQSVAEDIWQLVAANDFAAARETLENTPHSQIDEQFLEAQILMQQGRPEKASVIYRKILSAQPGLITVRQLLARALLQSGDMKAARFHYRILLESDNRPGMRMTYLSALRVIQRRMPSGITTSIALIQSSNINRGTFNSVFRSGFGVFQIDPSNKEVSGVGLQFGATAFIRRQQGSNGLLTFSAQAQGTVYDKSEFNNFQPTLSVNYQNTGVRSIWNIGGFVRRGFRNRDSDYANIGLTFSGRRILQGPHVLNYALTGQSVDYDTEPSNSGQRYSADLGLTRQLNPTFAIGSGLKISRGLHNAGFLSFRKAGIYAGASKIWSGGWSGSFGIEVGKRSYDEDFTSLAYPRADNYTVLTVSMLNAKIRIKGFTPKVSCVVQINKSNIAFYEYDATDCSFQFTRNF